MLPSLVIEVGVVGGVDTAAPGTEAKTLFSLSWICARCGKMSATAGEAEAGGDWETVFCTCCSVREPCCSTLALACLASLLRLIAGPEASSSSETSEADDADGEA